MAAQHFTAKSEGTLSPVKYYVDSAYVDVPGSIDVTINAHSIGDFVAYHDEWDDALWEYKARGIVRAEVHVTRPDGTKLDLKLTAQVKKVFASPYTDSYHLECEYKGETYGMYVLLDAIPGPVVWLQFLAPYLGTYGGAGWAYAPLAVSDGDFSFTYNH